MGVKGFVYFLRSAFDQVPFYRLYLKMLLDPLWGRDGLSRSMLL
jgi:hypothetical protein